MGFVFSHSIVDDYEAPAATREAIRAIRTNLVINVDEDRRLDEYDYAAIISELRKALAWADQTWLEAETRVFELIHEAGGTSPVIAALDAVSAHARTKTDIADVIFISIPEFLQDVKKYAENNGEIMYYYRRYLKYSDMSSELVYMFMRFKYLYQNVYKQNRGG